MNFETPHQRGNTIDHGFNPCNGHTYDSILIPQGWERYKIPMMDATRFGVWIDSKTHRIFTYNDGDTALVSCKTADKFDTEINIMDAFYDDSPTS